MLEIFLAMAFATLFPADTTQAIIPTEDQYPTDVPNPKTPSGNHDQRQVTDALAVFDLMQHLDNTLTLGRFDSLMRVPWQIFGGRPEGPTTQHGQPTRPTTRSAMP